MTNGDLQALGEMLREAREAQAFSLQEVEAQTRIRAKFLQAFEQGDISDLPSIAHAKGFLRNYAQFLHLDVDDMIARFAQATGTGVGTLTQPTAVYPREQVAPPAHPGELHAINGLPCRHKPAMLYFGVCFVKRMPSLTAFPKAGA